MFKNYAAMFSLFLFICLPALLTGCDNSGYMMQEPYTISGTVATGQPVTGTVQVFTYKRFDMYETTIDPQTGWYSVTIDKPDAPYILRARLDGDKTYFSITSGERNPIIEDISDLTNSEIDILLDASGLSDDTISALSDEEYDQLLENELAQLSEAGVTALLKTDRDFPQTVNITPLTDLVMGLAYESEPQATFAVNVFTSAPPATPLRQMKKRLDDQLSATYTYLESPQDPSIPNHDFNMFHSDMTENMKLLMSFLKIVWIDYPEKEAVFLTAKDELLFPDAVYDPDSKDPNTDYLFFKWDFVENKVAFDQSDMTAADVLNRLKTIPEFPDYD